LSYCIISRKNISHNIEEIVKKISKEKIAIVLKSNAYGHGLELIASLANENKIRHAVVRDYKEAIIIYDLFDTILVLSDIPKEEKVILKKIHITINTIEDISKIASGSSVELKIDTGMHRNGIEPEELQQAISLIEKYKLNLKGVFTHFADANNKNNSIYMQKDKFDQTVLRISKLVKLNKIRIHCSSSSGLFRFDNSEYDLVRIGIAIYGYIGLSIGFNKPILKPILSLWGEKISTRILKKDDSVGYGGAYTAKDDMEISTYDVGYADGFFRLNERKKAVLSNGNPVLGRVSMESFSTIGAEAKVCVFNDVTELAKIHDTTIYEILVSVSYRINRILQ
jgi:alanine racemase